jgi:hypothetical protein
VQFPITGIGRAAIRISKMRTGFRMPAFWLAVPVFVVSLLASGLSGTFGPVAGMIAAAFGALAIGWYAESRL